MNKILQQAIARAKQTQSITSERITASLQSTKIDIDIDELVTLLTRDFSNEVYRRTRKQATISGVSKNIKVLAQWLTQPAAKPSLIILGGIGTGKSTLMTSLVSTIKGVKSEALTFLKDEGWRIDASERDKAWSQAHNLPSIYMVSSTTLVKNPDLAEKCAKYPGILCIDDLGVEETYIKEFGTVKSPVVDIIYSRYDSMLPMVITTNLDIAGIKDKYGERVSDRLTEICGRIVFDGKSYRN